MVAEEEKLASSPYYKIPFSDVVAKKRAKNTYWGRKWNVRDMIYGTVLLVVHGLCLFAPFYFNRKAFWLGVVLYWITGYGITISFHRNLAHSSFKLPKVLEYLFAYCASHAIQGHPIDWVSKHRFHHKYVDTERDPHSPIDGFWFSHVNWLLDVDYMLQKTVGKRKNVADLRKQFFYRFMRRTYLLHPIALGILLYKLGGMPFVAWGMGVRTVWLLHVTFLVNSACHIWGRRDWNTRDLSKNNWLVALFTFGEGWHNNHHAFEFSATFRQKWWEVDFGWCVIKLLERVGLATDVKVPSEPQKQKMMISSSK
ncbi:hypothetical protein Syun_005488 [Stephania yunnanensis]|uniref:Fatty acid desaturase domain-containing protein n=1 Tax=Stephania yunnanensis TaxID=152371 RepID=A0AAP0L554_9MAGN